MTAAISWPPAAMLAPAPLPAPPRRLRTPKPARVGQRIAKVPSLFAVSCVICEKLSPISTNPIRGNNPPKRSGWLFTAIANMEGWVCRGCHVSYRRLLPPPTRGDCMDGPRPCSKTLCRYHLEGDVSRKAKDDFELSETCALDIADKGEHTLRQIGHVLGMTREGSRYVILQAVVKLRTITGLAFDFEDDVDEDGREGDGA